MERNLLLSVCLSVFISDVCGEERVILIQWYLGNWTQFVKNKAMWKLREGEKWEWQIVSSIFPESDALEDPNLSADVILVESS